MAKVSDETLLRDIKNTREELEAYHLLAKGHSILSTMPENTETQKQDHLHKKEMYEILMATCDGFLRELLTIKAVRGLQEVEE
jgi:hypothetical protein